MTGRSASTHWRSLAMFLVACLGVAALGAQFEPGPWYEGLTKPSWTPPNWIFPPVWGLLYLTIAFAGWLVWREGGVGAAKAPLALYATQLTLNAAWSWLFFGLHRPGWAFAEILLLWTFILMTILAFRRVSRVAAALLLPYFAWVSFAVLLNAALWHMNR